VCKNKPRGDFSLAIMTEKIQAQKDKFLDMVLPGAAAFALLWLDFHRSTTSGAALCGSAQIFSADSSGEMSK